jgi:hypothetical protein
MNNGSIQGNILTPGGWIAGTLAFDARIAGM